jgi:hypothetical protein
MLLQASCHLRCLKVVSLQTHYFLNILIRFHLNYVDPVHFMSDKVEFFLDNIFYAFSVRTPTYTHKQLFRLDRLRFLFPLTF